MAEDLVTTIPPRERISWREWAVLTIILCLGFGIWHVDVVAAHAQQAGDNAAQAATINRDVVYRNRAVLCDLIQALGKQPPPACADPHVTMYLPNLNPTSPQARWVPATLKTPATQCAGAG